MYTDLRQSLASSAARKLSRYNDREAGFTGRL